jgi:hypothetical protein
MALRKLKPVLVDQMDSHDSMLLVDLPDERPRYVADDDCSDWYFDRLEKEAELI